MDLITACSASSHSVAMGDNGRLWALKQVNGNQGGEVVQFTMTHKRWTVVLLIAALFIIVGPLRLIALTSRTFTLTPVVMH